MTITVKHAKTLAIPDGADTSVARPSDWNADHQLTGVGTMAEQNANAAVITGGAIDGTVIGGTTKAAGSFTTLTASGTAYLGGAAGAEALRGVPGASAVNRATVYGTATGVFPTLSAEGSDANLAFEIRGKGTGGHFFTTNSGSTQFTVAHTASAVNRLQATGGAAAAFSPYFSAQGSDANIAVSYQSKATGGHDFYNGGNKQFSIVNTTAAVNYLQVTGGATGTAASVSAQGSDANIDLALTPKGTGNIKFGTWTTNADAAINGYITIKDAAGTTRKLATIA